MALILGLAMSTAWAAPDEHPAAEGDPPPELLDEELEAARQGELLSPTFDELSVLEGFQSGGFLEGSDDLEFYWHGELSTEARAVIQRAEDRGQRVHLVYTPYSEEEAWEIALAVAKAVEQAGIRLSGFGANRMHDTIEILGPELSVSPELQDRARTVAAPALPSGMGLAFLPDEVGGTFDSRHADSGAPTPGNQVNYDLPCSGALGLANPGVRNYLLTAAHCVGYASYNPMTIQGSSLDDGAESAYVGTLLGSASYNDEFQADKLVDAALIGLPESAVESQMFYGSNVSATKVDIVGTSTIPYDTNLCSNGSATGTRCNFERSTEQVRRCFDFCTWWADIVGVNSVNGTVMFGEHDSGGAIYRVSSGERFVVAIVQGYRNETVNCGSLNYYQQFVPPGDPPMQCVIHEGRITAISTTLSELREAEPDFFVRVTG